MSFKVQNIYVDSIFEDEV